MSNLEHHLQGNLGRRLKVQSRCFPAGFSSTHDRWRSLVGVLLAWGKRNVDVLYLASWNIGQDAMPDRAREDPTEEAGQGRAGQGGRGIRAGPWALFLIGVGAA